MKARLTSIIPLTALCIGLTLSAGAAFAFQENEPRNGADDVQTQVVDVQNTSTPQPTELEHPGEDEAAMEALSESSEQTVEVESTATPQPTDDQSTPTAQPTEVENEAAAEAENETGEQANSSSGSSSDQMSAVDDSNRGRSSDDTNGDNRGRGRASDDVQATATPMPTAMPTAIVVQKTSDSRGGPGPDSGRRSGTDDNSRNRGSDNSSRSSGSADGDSRGGRGHDS